MSLLRTSAAELAPVRAEPRDDAEQVTQVLRGEPVTVDERRDGCALIRTAYDYPGWVRDEMLGGDEDSDWMTRESDDPVERARQYLGTAYLWGGRRRGLLMALVAVVQVPVAVIAFVPVVHPLVHAVAFVTGLGLTAASLLYVRRTAPAGLRPARAHH